MKLNRIMIAGIGGTLAMTLFSYLFSEKKDKNFKEPELLGKLVHRVLPEVNNKESQVAGWSLHFIAGVCFAAVYYQMLKRMKLEPGIANGLLVGGLSGIPAVAIWATVFELHPFPPKLTSAARKNYYMHLIAAHIIFGAFTFMTFSAEKRNERL